jgi:hypothetical protein
LYARCIRAFPQTSERGEKILVRFVQRQTCWSTRCGSRDSSPSYITDTVSWTWTNKTCTCVYACVCVCMVCMFDRRGLQCLSVDDSRDVFLKPENIFFCSSILFWLSNFSRRRRRRSCSVENKPALCRHILASHPDVGSIQENVVGWFCAPDCYYTSVAKTKKGAYSLTLKVYFAFLLFDLVSVCVCMCVCLFSRSPFAFHWDLLFLKIEMLERRLREEKKLSRSFSRFQTILDFSSKEARDYQIHIVVASTQWVKLSLRPSLHNCLQ